MATPTVTILSVTNSDSRFAGTISVRIKDEDGNTFQDTLAFDENTTVQSLKAEIKAKLDVFKNRKTIADTLRTRIGQEIDLT